MKPLTAIWVTIPAVAASLVVLENVASNTSRTARRKAGPANRRYESGPDSHVRADFRPTADIPNFALEPKADAPALPHCA